MSKSVKRGADDYQRLAAAIAGQPLPLALVDLGAFDANLDAMLKPVRAAGKTLRLATKSIRCPALLRLAIERGGPAVRGLLTFSAAETAALAGLGFRDLLLAYPTAQASDAAILADLNGRQQEAAVAVDCEEHVALLEDAAARARTSIPLVIDVDVAWRPVGKQVHVGVRRSPLREPPPVVALAKRIAGSRHLTFAGLLAYEAQIAGLGDEAWIVRQMKRLSTPDVSRARQRLVEALATARVPPRLFNGGGTGSLQSAAADGALTEIAAGSGLLCGHSFDRRNGVPLVPALYFGLQVTRRPAKDLITVQGAGRLIGSGSVDASRLPLPALPAGLALLPLEGAGEVQTPLKLPKGLSLPLGAPVFFRPAKSGEPLEAVNEVLLVRGAAIVGRAPTYRGMGHAFGV